MNFARSMVTVGSWTMGSRVLGFVRDILIARFLGAGPVADAFFVAFKLPNFFRRLFAEGAFNAAFVPQFARRLEAEGAAAARFFAESALAVMLAVLWPFTLLAIVAMPVLVALLAPGFARDSAVFDLTVDLARITFPYLLLASLAALMGGVLNSLGRFAAPAAAPILLNLVLIAVLLLGRDIMPGPAHALAWGVALAGIAQLLLLTRACVRAGTGLWLRRPRLTPGVRRLLRLMVPGAIGAGVVQINLMVDTVLASTLDPGAISYLYFADRVNQLPLGVVGIAVGVALLPLLSRQWRAGDMQAAAESQNHAVAFALLMAVPAAVALTVMPEPVIRVLFERGAFTPEATLATARALAAFAFGLPAYVLIKALAPGFHAREDTATPVKIATLGVAVNILLAITLMPWLGHVGIAMATALSAWLNAGLMGVVLWRRGAFQPDRYLRRRCLRLLLAAGLMGAALASLTPALQPALASSRLAAIAALTALIGTGLLIYAGLAIWLGAITRADWQTLTNQVRVRCPD